MEADGLSPGIGKKGNADQISRWSTIYLASSAMIGRVYYWRLPKIGSYFFPISERTRPFNCAAASLCCNVYTVLAAVRFAECGRCLIEEDRMKMAAHWGSWHAQGAVRMLIWTNIVLSRWSTPCVLCYLQGAITNILEENVIQPLLVSTSAIHLSSETVRSILKIDDIVSSCIR